MTGVRIVKYDTLADHQRNAAWYLGARSRYSDLCGKVVHEGRASDYNAAHEEAAKRLERWRNRERKRMGL